MIDAPDLRQWEPPIGVLRECELVWTPTSDAPREYHVAAGLAVIAATVENRVYLPFGGDRIYPNVWALLLGPSSFFRKSTCVGKARKTLNRLEADAGPTENRSNFATAGSARCQRRLPLSVTPPLTRSNQCLRG